MVHRYENSPKPWSNNTFMVIYTHSQWEMWQNTHVRLEEDHPEPTTSPQALRPLERRIPLKTRV